MALAALGEWLRKHIKLINSKKAIKFEKPSGTFFQILWPSQNPSSLHASVRNAVDKKVWICDIGHSAKDEPKILLL